MKKTINNICKIFLLLLVVGILSCDEEDFTGYSTLVPTSPTITVTPDFTSPVTLTEDGSKYAVTVTLSEVQVVDVKLDISQVGGTASSSDYSVPGSVTIGVGTTSASFDIEILMDDEVEDQETLTLQVGDAKTANASITPVTLDFVINNYTSDALSVDLSWVTDVASAVGIDDDPADVANIALLVLNESDLSTVVELTDAGFKSYNGWDSLADGNYIVAATFVDLKDYGDANSTLTFGMTLDFGQSGIAYGTMEFADIVTNEFACATVSLAEVQKSGSSYTYSEIGETSVPFDVDALDGVHSGVDLINLGGAPTEFTLQNGSLDSVQVWGFFTYYLNAWSVASSRTDSAFANLIFDASGNLDYSSRYDWGYYQEYYCMNDEGGTDGDWMYYIEIGYVDGSHWNPCTGEIHVYYDIIYFDPSTGYASYGWMFDPDVAYAVIDLNAKTGQGHVKSTGIIPSFFNVKGKGQPTRRLSRDFVTR